MDNESPGPKSVARAVMLGFALGVLFALPALFAAILSAGAGHGDYVAARALFPVSMLLTLVEGRIGYFSMALALLQFPLYGALLEWTKVRRNYLPALVVAAVHLVAAIVSFAGALPGFS